IPTSPRAPAIGLPTLRDSIRASSSPCSSTSVASRRSSRARSAGATARQAGNAAFARATAASASSTPACSSSASGSSVAGLRTVSIGLFHHLHLKRGAPAADEGGVAPVNEASHSAVEELVAHYEAKARAVSRTGVAIGAFAGVLIGSIPLSPIRAAWPIPSSYGFATLL